MDGSMRFGEQAVILQHGLRRILNLTILDSFIEHLNKLK